MDNQSLNYFDSSEDATTNRTKNALRISVIALSAAALSAIVYLIFAVQSGAWQLYAWSASTGAIALAAIISFLSIRRGYASTGIWLLLITIQITSAYSVTLIDGIGIPVGITIAIVSTIIAGQTLPARQSGWAITLGVIGGVTAMFLELYLPYSRFLQTPYIRIYLPTTVAVVLLLFGYLTVQQFRYYFLRTKLTIVFITIVFISIGLITSVSSAVLRANLAKDLGSQLYTIAKSKATEIGQVIKREANTLSTLTYNKLVQQSARDANETGILSQAQINRLDQQWQSGNSEQLVNSVTNNELGDEFRRFQKEFPQYSEIFLTDKQGVIIATTNRTTDYYQADEEWWTRSFREGKFIGQPEYDESSGTISVIVASRVRAPDTGEAIGVLRATVALTAFADSLSSGLFGKTGHVDIYLPRGQEIRLQPDVNGNNIVTLTDAETDITPFVTSASKYLEILINNVPTIASEYPVRANADATNDDDLAISNLTWRVLVLQDQSEAFQAIETQTRNNLLLTIVISILVALAALGISQAIAAPVSRLTTVASQIASGDLSTKAKAETGDEIGILAITFNKMTAQLRDLVGSLERRVEERTAELERRANQLETISSVARAIASVQSIDDLLPAITKLVSEQFNFYHVGIFLVDQDKEYAVLRAANSAGGKKMLERNHKLKLDANSIVGYSTSRGEPRIALDVGTDAVYFNNPDLPNTHSEMSLPLRIGKNVIGALDVQSTEPNAFSNEDISSLATLADQVAIAIENARLFGEARIALKESEETFTRYVKREWNSFSNQAKSTGYLFDGSRTIPFDSKDKQKRIQALPQTGRLTLEKDAKELAIPIRLRGQIIGYLDVKPKSNTRKWTQDDMILLEAAAERAALALENARLVETAERRASRERTIGEISTKIGAVSDLDAIMQAAVEELGRKIGGAAEVTLELDTEQDKS